MEKVLEKWQKNVTNIVKKWNKSGTIAAQMLQKSCTKVAQVMCKTFIKMTKSGKKMAKLGKIVEIYLWIPMIRNIMSISNVPQNGH